MRMLLKPMLWTLALSACTSATEQTESTALQMGTWRAVINMQDKELPFTFELSAAEEGNYDIYLINGEERLLIDEVVRSGDSLIMPMSFFDTQIRAAIREGELSGEFIKNYAEGYRLPFRATYGDDYRFV
ncbi:MAG: TlpA family protein disulfide reductase, partial [Cyclobacteriaceae bacterium]